MELKYVKPLIALGVPGVSLGIFYLLYHKFDFSFSQVPPILTGAIVIVFLLIIGLVTIFALHRFAPKAAISTTSQAEQLTTLPQQEQASLLKIRDIETIKMAFSEISLVALDNFIEDARSCILDLSTIHFYEGYKAVLLSNSFHLNNNQTQTRLVSLLEAWGTVLNAADSFVPTPGEMRHRLPKPHEVPSGTNLELIRQKFL
ncbi:MAG: hypothetical protein Q8O00_08675, partial [Holophaga sp.]|nr:hypothetical protein [Holophaga sp.]